MQQEPSIGRADFRLAFLPERAAYLVAAGDRAGVIEAVREASTRWAGATEPIIPVRKSGAVDSRWRRVLDLSGVDGLVNVNVSTDTAAAAQQKLGLPMVPLAQIDETGRTRWTSHPLHLEPGAAFDKVQSAVLSRPDGSLLERVAAGDYYPERVAQLTDEPGLGTRCAGSLQDLVETQLDRTTWLDFGVSQFREHQIVGGPWSVPAVIWVAKLNGLLDCLYYWNLRALRSFRLRPAPMLLLPYRAELDWDQVSQRLIEKLQRPDEIEPDVVLGSLTIDNSGLQEIARKLRLVASEEPIRALAWTTSRKLRSSPYSYRSDLEVFRFFDWPRSYGAITSVTEHVYRALTTIDVSPPVKFRGAGNSLVKISSSAFDGLPRNQTVAEMIFDHAEWLEGELCLRTTVGNPSRLALRIPTLEEAAWKVLRNSALDASLSEKGQVAHRLHELGGYPVLLVDAVPRVVGALVTPRSNTFKRELRKAAEDGTPFDEIDELALRLGGRSRQPFRSALDVYREDGNRGSLSAVAAALEAICTHEWAERGLSISCDRCRFRSFVPLREANDRPRCPACRSDQSYETNSASCSPEVSYRLNGFIDLAADQGLLPHLQAAAALERVSKNTYLLLGTNVKLVDGGDSEVDIFGAFLGRIVAGEAKSNPSDFDAEQLERDVKLSASLGADAHMMTAPRKIPSATLGAAKLLCYKHGVKLIVIEAGEVHLPPDWH